MHSSVLLAQDPQLPAKEAMRRRVLLQVAVTQALTALNEGAGARALKHLADCADVAAESETASYDFGLIHFNAGETDTALAWFEHALFLQPEYPEALSGRGVLLHRLGRPDDALASFVAVQTLRPRDAEAFHMAGVVLQSLGRLPDALASYERALRLKPDYHELLSNCGAVLDEIGRLPDALVCFEAARQLSPDDPQTLFNCGSVLQRLERYEDALAAYGRAERSGGSTPELALNRGNTLQKLGNPVEALTAYAKALSLRPRYAQAYYNQAIALHALERFGEALDAYDAALAIEPSYAEALCNRGNTLSALGRHAAALASYDAALVLKPDLLQALTNRANLLLRQGDTALAIETCERALQQAPDNALALCIRGAAFQTEGRHQEALASLDAALASNPAYPEALQNKGNALQGLSRYEDAIACYEAAIALKADFAEAWSSRGVAMKEMGRIGAALACFDEALRLKPIYPDARNNRAGVLLLSGRLREGFEDFEARWDRGNAPRRALMSALPAWNGEPIEGKRIIVVDEQGLGDLLHFSRYLPMLCAAGADVTFMCRKDMHGLMATLPASVRLVENITSDAGFDYQVALLSLPRAFHTTLESIPAPSFYLAADPERVAYWRDRLGRTGLKIGVCAHGRPGINLGRTFPLECLAPIAAIPDVRLISLMQHMPAGAASGPAIDVLDAPFDVSDRAFFETAAVMANLDLVITSDTAIAHLAGALGRPVFVALKHVPDWRWLTERDDSPWYPTMRLFRQEKRGEWGDVFGKIASCVEEGARARRQAQAAPVAIPSGIGDLLDKITILEIKAEVIQDAAKLCNIGRELAMLQALRTQLCLDTPRLTALENALKTTNAKLWIVEDALRDHEKARDFGTAFVDLARQVYKLNDKRAVLKREINLLFDSPIVEEKSYALEP